MNVEQLGGLRKREMIRSMIESIDLEDVMNTDVGSVGPDTPLNDVLAKMRKNDLHEITVVDGRTMDGVISFGSLLKRKNIPVSTKARSVMENPPEVPPDTDITEVAEKMVSTGYRQVPVVDNDEVIGTVSRMEVAKIIREINDLGNIPVEEIMTLEVNTVKGKDSLQKATDIMKSLDIRTIPVLDDLDRLAGIIGIKDIVDYTWRERDRETIGEIVGRSTPVEIKVDSLSIDSPYTISPDSKLSDAVEIMVSENISTLPVVNEDGEIVGILTTYDLVELIASLKDRDMVYVQITGLEDEDRYSMDVMEKEIQSGLSKIAKISRPLLFTIHVAKYNKEGNTAKYSLSSRLTTEHQVFMAKSVDWNIMKATIQLMERFQKMVTKKKEELIDQRKKRRR